MVSQFCRFHALIRQHVIIHNTLRFCSLSLPYQVKLNSVYDLSYFLLYSVILRTARFIAFNTVRIHWRLELVNWKQYHLFHNFFCFQLLLSSHFFIIKTIQNSSLKQKFTHYRLFATYTDTFQKIFRKG